MTSTAMRARHRTASTPSAASASYHSTSVADSRNEPTIGRVRNAVFEVANLVTQLTQMKVFGLVSLNYDVRRTALELGFRSLCNELRLCNASENQINHYVDLHGLDPCTTLYDAKTNIFYVASELNLNTSLLQLKLNTVVKLQPDDNP